MGNNNDYNEFFEFIDTYLQVGFEGIDYNNPLMRKINSMMRENNQFFFIADMIKMEIQYTCKTCYEHLGFESEFMEPARMFSNTHPDDLKRHGINRGRMIRLCNDTFANDDDYALMSTSLRHQHTDGHYTNFLVQGYVFSKTLPEKSVYCLFIYTDIGWYGEIKHGFHYYIGKDLSYFKVPDKKLIETGSVFTNREFEILALIRQGFDSKAIGTSLFLSPHTIDTHRRNILKKTRKISTSDLIFELQESGFF